MHCLKIAIAGSMLFPLFVNANSYPEIMEQLGIEDPEFLVHVNVEKDFNTLGEILSDVYLEYLKTAPDVPPVPVSFETLFDRLGLTTLESITMSSERVPGGFLNQSLSCFENGPQGMFQILGTENTPFEIIHSAPLDADILGEATFNASVYLEIVRNIIIDFMGPMGQGLVDAQLSQPLTEEGLTILDIINQMNTRIQFAAKLPDVDTNDKNALLAMLSGKAAISMQGMGGLVESLTPVLQNSGWENVSGSVWQMSIPMPKATILLRIEPINDAADLLLSFSEDSADWFLTGDSKPAGLVEVEKRYGEYPTEGLAFFYDVGKFSELQIKTMWADMEIDEKYDPMLKVVEDFLMRYVGPQLGVTFIDGNSQRTMAWQSASTKANLGMVAMAVPAGFAVGYGQAIEAAREAGAAEAAQQQDTGGSPPQ